MPRFDVPVISGRENISNFAQCQPRELGHLKCTEIVLVGSFGKVNRSISPIEG